MISYVINVTYNDDTGNGIIAIRVPDDVTVNYVLSEMTHLNHLFMALREIEYSDNSEDCLVNNLSEEELPRCKSMLDKLFASETDVEDVYANYGHNEKTLVDYLIQIHPEWEIDKIGCTTFNIDD